VQGVGRELGDDRSMNQGWLGVINRGRKEWSERGGQSEKGGATPKVIGSGCPTVSVKTGDNACSQTKRKKEKLRDGVDES